MPRLNRVTPMGEIIATPERGMFMGNRGILHDERGQMRRAWQVKRWLICVLEFRGRHRTIMAPHRYTELFFLDEATALAAGHRPCAECRHRRFLDFCATWEKAHPTANGERPRAADIDDTLHAERVAHDRGKRLFQAKLKDLPNGVFIRHPDRGVPYLVWKQRLLAWSPGGYTERVPRPRQAQVHVVTPISTVAAIAAGYTPEIHPSAAGS